MTRTEAFGIVLETMYCSTEQAEMTVDMLVKLGLLKLDPPVGGQDEGKKDDENRTDHDND